MKSSIMLLEEDQEIYTGKIIGDTFYRNFNFSSAVLWQTRELSMDKRTFDYIKTKVKKIVFMDVSKNEAFGIGIRKLANHIRIDSYGEGEQVYVKKDLCTKLDEYPDVPFVSKKVVINEAAKPIPYEERNPVDGRKVYEQRKRLKDAWDKLMAGKK